MIQTLESESKWVSKVKDFKNSFRKSPILLKTEHEPEQESTTPYNFKNHVKAF